MFEYFKSIIDQDTSAVVVCDTDHKIIYVNPAACKSYEKYGGADLLGRSLLDCHNDKSKELIIKVLDWFCVSKEHNIVHTYFNEKQNKDVYMVALRGENGELIGYYEKHEYRDRDITPFYCFK